MWRIFGRDAEGRRREAPSRPVPEADRNRIIAISHDVMTGGVRSAFDADLDRPGAIPIPGVDGVDAWGPRAAELVGTDLDGTGLTSEQAVDERTKKRISMLQWTEKDSIATAFHEPDAIVADVSGLKGIEIERENEPPWQLPSPPSKGLVEFRAYSQSGVTEGDAEFDPNKSREAVRLPIEGGDEPHGIVMRICQLAGSALTRPLPEPHDPFMQGRLKGSEEQFDVFARKYPDISEEAVRAGRFRAVSKAEPGPVMVFIHGTFSCALPSLAQLPRLQIQAFRYEHDTFRRVSDNANELIAAINKYAPDVTHLYLVGHSRGGLVARVAGLLLDRGDPPVDVLTFGTPHDGTPVANAGTRLFNLILSSGRTAVGAIPLWDPVSMAGKLFLRWRLPSAPPPGIVAMRPKGENDFLQALAVPNSLHSWGAVYDGHNAPGVSRKMRFAYGGAKGAFKKEPNDLIVSTASATNTGTGMPFLSCNHFEYFATTEVQKVIGGLR